MCIIKRMKLIVGLGNPGKEYENTRHNTGFLCLDKVARALDVKINRRAFNALIGKTTYRGEQVILMKPQTYMNLSGEAVGKAVRYYHLDPGSDVLVVYDDLDLPVGNLRLREGGSAGGHNGIKSIIAHLSTQQFCRIRVGIGSDKKEDTRDYVLSGFWGEDIEKWQKAIDEASKACVEFINNRFQDVMNRHNRRNRAGA